MLEQVVAAHPDDVRIVYRHFPLNQIHPNAQKAAEASEAAGAQGAFWEYHDALYAQQAAWSRLDRAEARQYFIDLATELGLDADRFTAELDGDVYAAYVAAQEQEAINLGLPGTPAAIVDGQLVAGNSLPFDFAVWDAFVTSTVAVQALAERQYAAPPPMQLTDGVAYLARIQMENGAEFVIELFPDSAPQTVNSFIFLAREGWFDGVTFHRVLPDFVAQTGDPSATGQGGPGYTIPNEIDPALSHNRAGMVAMANAGPDTNGSQWYVTLGDVSRLDGGYTIFGQVVSGLDVVQAITPRDPARDPQAPPGDRIKTVTIEEGR